jgi:hypothetical protein
VKQAVRQSSQEAPAPSRRVPSISAATAVQFSVIPGGGTPERGDEPSTSPDATAARRRSGRTELVFGGTLALILLIACLTWEVLADRDEGREPSVQEAQGLVQTTH